MQAQGCSNFRLRQMARRVSRIYDHHLAEVGLTGTQYSTLGTLARLGPVGQRELARQLGLDASTLARNLRLMIGQGWIRQEPGPDARSRLVRLTDAGRQTLTEGRRCWREAQRALTGLMGAERIRVLHQVLDEGLSILSHHQDDDGDATQGAGSGTEG